MNGRHRLWALGVALATGILFTGCADNGKDPNPSQRAHRRAAGDSAEYLSRSPAEVVLLMQNLHQQRDYDGISELIVEDAREATVNWLMAVDSVLSANARLQDIAEAKYGGPMAEGWNLAAMENNLGPFSARLTLIHQQFKGETSLVTFQEGRHVPLVHARFELGVHGWKYRPDAAPPDAMAAELKRLARILDDVAVSVKRGAPFESYLDAFAYRVLPQIAKVTTAGADGPREVVAARDTR